MAVMGLLTASSAWAAPGEHITAGDARIVPGVAVGVDYTNNAYHEAVVDSTSGAVSLEVSPSIQLKLSRDDLDIGLRGTYELHKYFTPATVNLDRYDDFGISGNVDALKKSRIGFRFSEALGIENYPVEAQSDAHPYTKQLQNITTAAIAARPGTALEFSVGGRYAMDDYGTPVTAHADGTRHYNTRHAYGPTAGGVWQLLPRTAVLVDFGWEHAYYMSPTLTDSTGATISFPDHNMWRITGGLRGRIVDRLSLTAIVGYGDAVYDETSVSGASADATQDVTGLEHLLFNAGIRYDLSDDDKLNLGVSRDFRDSFFTNYVSYTRGYLSTELHFGKRVGVDGEFGITPESFRGEETRDDIVLDAKLDATYYIREWVWVTAGGGWQERSSSNASVEFDEFTGHITANVNY